MQVKIIAKNDKLIPEYKTKGAAACDLRAYIGVPIELKPMQRVVIPSGIQIQCPLGYKADIKPRSGLGINHGIILSNCIGLIDEDYTGEISIGLINLGTEAYTINPYDRVCQMEIVKYEQAEFIEVEALEETERGSGGLGHTGR